MVAQALTQPEAEESGLNVANAGSAATAVETNENAIYTQDRYERVRLSVSDYREVRERGFLKMPSLIPAADILEISKHMDDVLDGKVTAPGFPKINPSMPEAERVALFGRIHNAHRVHPLHERILLHPRILDVIEQLNGPDVLALQSMSFFKQPGHPGQGYHQDSYYIPTLPNTLIAAWVAISEATEENGCLWFCAGSQNEPLYPQRENEFTHASRKLDDVFDNTTASLDDPASNQLTAVANRYLEVACPAKPGDVIFFHGNMLHRSHANRSDVSRRAFAGHYCDARSFVPWNIGEDWSGSIKGQGANFCHILARGDSHLPFAKPSFGTPCAALEERTLRVVGSKVAMPMGDSGKMTIGNINSINRGDD